MRNRPPQILFFDIGNVLLYFDHDRMFRQMGELCGCDPARIRQELEESEHNVRYETGGLNTIEVYELLHQMGTKSFTLEQLIPAMSEIFHPNEEMFPLIRTLKKNGIRLGLLSNTCEAHYDFFAPRYDIFELFDVPILSHLVQARKPDPAIFNAALNAAGCSPEECFYVDDIPEYVAAARSLGIDAELFTSTRELKPHLIQRLINF